MVLPIFMQPVAQHLCRFAILTYADKLSELKFLTLIIGILFMQVMVSQSSSFEGDIEGRELRQMPFSEFLAPPAASSPESQHYLAQVPIWSRNCPQETPLEALLPDIVLPAYLDPARSTCLQSINFWMASRCALQLHKR